MSFRPMKWAGRLEFLSKVDGWDHVVSHKYPFFVKILTVIGLNYSRPQMQFLCA